MRMQGSTGEGTIRIKKYYGSLAGMRRKFDRRKRQDAFPGGSVGEFEIWQQKERGVLGELIGLPQMERCSLEAKVLERIEVEENLLREKVLLQVEPEVWMPVYVLIPEGEKKGTFLALPGHLGAGKYSVAGCSEIPVVKKSIEQFQYDYGLRLARRGYVTLCPDCRGFGERRDEDLQGDSPEQFLNSTCFQLAHMAEPLGQTVIGMCTWDFMRLIDYVYERGEWDVEEFGCVGFSGGGMQTLWLSALDERVKRVIISGYFYGYEDSLLVLNGNCSCNYVPGLWEHVDMGDITSLIAPRNLAIQSCKGDHLNGARGLENVYEQMEIVRQAYALYGEKPPLHDIREGEHCFHPEIFDRLNWL